jgi:hypothetical protein
MALSYQEYTVTTALDTYLFTKPYLDQTDIVVTTSSGGAVFTATTNFTLSGGEGNLTIDLLDSRTIGDIVRIRRISPDTPVVDFQPGTLSSVDLDRAFKQSLYLVQEERDFPGVDYLVDLGVGVPFITETTGDSTSWDTDGKKVSNMVDGIADSDGATVGQTIAALALAASTAQPAAAALADGIMIAVSSGTWVAQGATQMRTNLGLGTASLTDTGVASDANVPTYGESKAKFPQLVNNLSDLPTVATARTNLGLGTVAELNTGVASGDIPILDANGLPAVSGQNLVLTDNPSVVKNNVVIYGTNATASTSTGATLNADTTGRVIFGTNSTYNSSAVTVNMNTGAADSYCAVLTGGVWKVSAQGRFVHTASSAKTSTLSMRVSTQLDGLGAWTTYDLASITSNDGGDHGQHTVHLTGSHLVSLHAVIDASIQTFTMSDLLLDITKLD